MADDKGNLYGTTQFGGGGGNGTVFRFSPKKGTEQILYSFSGAADGGQPYGGVVSDGNGLLYGTTYEGGNGLYGTVFSLKE